jgi:hypothetical protein
VGGGAEVTGDVSATGNVTAGADLAVAGDATFDDDVTVTGDLRAGTTTLAALAVSGAATIGGVASVVGDVHLGQALTVGGDVTATGDLNGRNLNAGGSGTFGTLSVGGTTTIGAGGDAFLITRHVVGKRSGSDGPDGLWLNWNTGQTVHVGGGSPADLDVSHDVLVGNDLTASRNVVVNQHIGVRNANPVFEVDVTGTVCAMTFCNPSDARLKTGVTDLTDVLDRLADVHAVSFRPVDGEAGTVAGRRAGVIAQQMQRAFPELVVPMGRDDLLAVDYAGLAGVLVGAVNELRKAQKRLADRLDQADRRGGDDDDR